MHDISNVTIVTLVFVNNAGQQRFWSMRKKSVSDVFLDAEFGYVSRISLSPTPFALHHTMRPHKPTYVSHWGHVGGSLDMM
jgi:hypothetical protein